MLKKKTLHINIFNWTNIVTATDYYLTVNVVWLSKISLVNNRHL